MAQTEEKTDLGKNIRVSTEKHTQAKIQATLKGKTIKEYVEELIDKDSTNDRNKK